jgi:hypothetical protein
MMKNLHKRMEGLEKTLADHNIAFESESGGSREVENSMALSPSFPTTISEQSSMFSPLESPLQKTTSTLDYDRQIMLDVFFQEQDNNPFSFIHEQTVRESVTNDTVSISFLNAICALSCW